MAASEPFQFCPRCGEPMEGEGGPRGNPTCGTCGFVQWWDPKVATGVVVEYAGRVLLVRRNHAPAYGRWSFPSGFVDAGEIIERAAAREVLEETGVEVSIDRLLGVYSTEGETTIFIAFAGTATGGEPHPDDAEVMEVGLFAADELPELAFPHDPAILAAWRKWREVRA